LRQIADAIEHCHKFKVVHRDLKPDNIIFSESMQIKLIDFGLSNMIVKPKKVFSIFWIKLNKKKLKTFCGSPITISPEMFDSEKGHSFEVDYWAIGVILFFMIFGQYPFESDNDSIDEIYELIKKNDPIYDEQNASKEAIELIK
jgi:serine/threonine protein kinase